MKNRDKLKKAAFMGLVFFLQGYCAVNAQNSSEDNNNAGISGIDCSAFGLDALVNNTSTGMDNTALGYNALFNNSTGDRNTAAGSQALYNNNGDDNTAVGYRALYNNTGDRNTAFGSEALMNNTSGDENTAMGYQALLANITGNNNTALGAYADVTGSAGNNRTAIGYMAVTSAGNNRMKLGSNGITLFQCMVNYSPSDGRIKNNLRYDEVKGLEFIKKLRPVVYNLNTEKLTDFTTAHMTPERKAIYMSQDFAPTTATRRSGFIAQEVEAAAKSCGYDFNGVYIPADPKKEPYSVSYALFVVPLVKSVQEQQAMIEDVQKEVLVTDRLLADAGTVGIKAPSTSEGFRMEANRPNPFSDETVIQYHLPQSISSAYLLISDLSGKQVVSYPLNEKGNASITITSEKLSAGIYHYSIVGDEKVLGTRKMVVTGK